MMEQVVVRQFGRGLDATGPFFQERAGGAFDAFEGATPVTRDCTALFTDLRGFSALTERLADDPMRLLEVINEHLTAVVRAITRCGARSRSSWATVSSRRSGHTPTCQPIGNAGWPRRSRSSVPTRRSTGADRPPGDFGWTLALGRRLARW